MSANLTDLNAAGTAVVRRIACRHNDLFNTYGIDRVLDAVECVTYHLTDLEEIGTSDVSCWVKDTQEFLERTNGEINHG